jgi:glycerophosphoryl diester phosphodiesterase
MAAGFPENTLAAYRNSVSLGFAAIELDLRATADGHIVVMHDDTEYTCRSGCTAYPNRASRVVRFPFAPGATTFAATTTSTQALQLP